MLPKVKWVALIAAVGGGSDANGRATRAGLFPSFADPFFAQARAFEPWALPRGWGLARALLLPVWSRQGRKYEGRVPRRGVPPRVAFKSSGGRAAAARGLKSRGFYRSGGCLAIGIRPQRFGTGCKKHPGYDRQGSPENGPNPHFCMKNTNNYTSCTSKYFRHLEYLLFANSALIIRGLQSQNSAGEAEINQQTEHIDDRRDRRGGHYRRI